MPFPPAPPLQLRPGDRETLEAMVRKRTLPQRSALRARIILYCADGLPHRQIKRQLNTSVDTVLRWRKRYEQQGIVDSICSATIWLLLDQMAIKPHRWHYWLNSPDPDFDIKMQDVVSLYLNALAMYREGEIVLSVDEKTSIQALERKHPMIQSKAGSIALIEHEYIRRGTCCLTAGFEVATGGVMGMLTPNRPAEVFAELMEWVCEYYCDARTIHIVLDNLNTHYHELTCQVVAGFCKCDLGQTKTGRQRKDFLTDPSKRVVFHFTPTHASWLSQIEIWFSTLSRKVIRRGDFCSVEDLEDKIMKFIEYHNECLARPYEWTYTGKPLATNKRVA